MKKKDNRGGPRKGAGRPKGTTQKEPTVVIRVPKSKVDIVKKFIKDLIMKTLAACTFILLLIACEDPEIKDPLTGHWWFQSFNVKENNPPIIVLFDLKKSDRSYTVENIKVSIDNSVSSDFTGTVQAVEQGDKIGLIVFENGGKSITLSDCDQLTNFPQWTVEKATYKMGTQNYSYNLQIIKPYTPH